MPSIPRAVRAIELVVAIWSVRLAPAVLLMRPPMMPRRCGVTQHVSKPNQPIESLVTDHRRSRFHHPPPWEWPAPISDSTIHPEQLLPQRLPWSGRHRLVGVDRTSTATSAPPAWPEFRPVTVDIDIPPERNTVLPMPLAGADGIPHAFCRGSPIIFRITPDQIPRDWQLLVEPAWFEPLIPGRNQEREAARRGEQRLREHRSR